MIDETEGIRRMMVGAINAAVVGDNLENERTRLEDEYHSKVWDTQELSDDFEVLGFAAPFCVVRSKATGKKGSLMFQHYPRFYFGFQED
jgi:hypothetical protein